MDDYRNFTASRAADLAHICKKDVSEEQLKDILGRVFSSAKNGLTEIYVKDSKCNPMTQNKLRELGYSVKIVRRPDSAWFMCDPDDFDLVLIRWEGK